MNSATFLMMSLAMLAPAAAFILDHQIYYQQSMEELSAEQNAIENTPKTANAKRDRELTPPPSSSYEDSAEMPALTSSELNRILMPEPEPESEESDALWHRTCGRKLVPKKRVESSKRSTGRRLLRGVHTIWRQLNYTMQQYRTMEYERLYTRMHKGVDERQYVPSWIPDRGDAVALSEMNVESKEHLSLALDILDTGLQKFAVALEQCILDEDDDERKRALRSTQLTLRSLLCEVEAAVTSQGWTIPPRVPRAIMVSEERITPDLTRRMLRDWGVLVRYGTFLRAWSTMMSRLYSAIITIHELNRANVWP